MRKILFTLLTCMATLTCMAQDNLALNKTSIATSGTASFGNDGNTGSRWESAHGVDLQKWQVDLGSEQDMNTFKIIWEGAYAKEFTIKVGNTIDDEGWLSDGTVAITVSNQSLTAFPATEVYRADNTVQGRYVLFEGKQRGTPYGYSFWEFEVYNVTEAPVVTNVALTATGQQPLTLGGTLTLNATCTDQMGGSIAPSSLTYNSSNTNVATIEGNVLTAVGAGTTTITAVADGVTSNAIEVTVLAAQKLDLLTNCRYRVYGIGEKYDATSMEGAFDNNTTGSEWSLIKGETGADEASRTYTVGFIVDLGGLYDVNEVQMTFEGACSENFTLAFAAEDGVFGEAAYTGGRTGINAHTETYTGNVQARYVRFVSTKAATQWSVKLFNFAVYGSGSPTADTQKPTVTASLGSAGEESVVLSITGNDNSAKYLAYEISAEDKPATIYALEGNKAGQATDVTINGLIGGTTYHFSIVAIDDKGNRSDAATVEATTQGEAFVLTAAPVPTKDAADVISIYSDSYTAATTWNIGGWGQSTQMSRTSIEGNEMLYLINYNYMGFDYFSNDLDLKDMQYLHIDVLPMQAMNLGITPIMRGGTPTEKSTSVGTLNVKEWNSIDIPLSTFGLDYANYTSFQLKIDGGNGKDILYVDNVYYWKGEGGTEPTELSIKEVDATTNAVVLQGVWSAEDFAAIDAEQKALAYDVSGVIGTVEGEIATVMPNALFITNTTQNVAKNRVVWNQSESLYEGYNIVFTENDTQTANGKDYSVNTNIAPLKPHAVVKERFHDGAGVYATTIAPFDCNVDSGIDAWEMTGSETVGENTTLQFSKVAEMQAGKAYIIYFARAAAFWLRGNEVTINWSADQTMAFKGTFTKVAKEDLGDAYVLNGNKAQPDFAKNAYDMPAWRGYLSGVSSAANISVIFDGVTGIEQMEQLIPTLFNVYSIDGRVVRQNADSMMSLPAGVYVVNGKKVVVK